MINRFINLTMGRELDLTNVVVEIPMISLVKDKVHYLLTHSNGIDYPMIEGVIENRIQAESIFVAAVSGDKIDNKNVALVIDKSECNRDIIMSLNLNYYLFDIQRINVLSFLSEINLYSQTLIQFKYNFFKLIFKCMCTVNTRICVVNHYALNVQKHIEQDFLSLIKILVNELAFTLEVDGFPYDVRCNSLGWVCVDGVPIILISDANVNMKKILIHLFKFTQIQYQ